jgi:Capsule polysaccharide biosynthesis protein
MKLLFIENRYATRLNEAVAHELLADGHEIGWIVQNPHFAPRLGQCHQLAFPSPADLRAPGDDPLFARMRRADRGVLHFGLSGNHHPHYLRETERVFDAFKPDVVFGESTQLHELLAIEVARRRGLPYLFPTASRYPPGRMCFLSYDTMQPVGGCGQPMPVAEATALIEAVNRRSVTPSYMSASTTPRVQQLLRGLGDRLRISYAWWRGERFITPSPWRKLALDRAQRQLQQRWDSTAQARCPSTRPYVLYPLQMQPESTIDVWGLPWNDQADIVRRAARALAPLGWDLVVKPNPKSKYEIDARLCAAAEQEPNLVAVAHGVPMQALFGPAGAVLSVTGTVLIEAVFAGKPALSLGEHAMAHYPGVTALAAPEHVADHLGAAPKAAADLALALLQDLHQSSYEAQVVCPLTQQHLISAAAIQRLSLAFRSVLERPGSHLACST